MGLLGGSSIFVIQLQGNLYFGNVQQVVDGIMTALSHHNSSMVEKDEYLVENPSSSPEPHFQVKNVILDCSFVTGADVNAVSGLLKMRDRIAEEYNSSKLINKTCYNNGYSNVDLLERSSGSDRKIDANMKKGEVKVRVIFAGLQESLEVMFAEQHKIRLIKENKKGRKVVEGDSNSRERRGSGTYRYRDLDHREDFKDLEMNDDNDSKKYGTNDVRVGHESNSRETAKIVSKLLNGDGHNNKKLSDQEESNYDSAHTYDSLSSDSDADSASASSSIMTALNNVKQRGSWQGTTVSVYETNEITKKKKKARSPSFGSTSTGNTFGITINSGSSSSGNHGKFSHPISITERMLKSGQDATKSVANYESISNSSSASSLLRQLPAPVPVRPSLLSRVINYETSIDLKEVQPSDTVLSRTVASRRLDHKLDSNPNISPKSTPTKRSLPALVTGYILKFHFIFVLCIIIFTIHDY